MANLILHVDASNPSSWGTDTPTTFQNWVDISGNSWTNQFQIINATTGSTLVDLNNNPTTVAASGTKGLRLKATTGGTYPNGTSVQQRGEWAYGNPATPGDPAYSLYSVDNGTYTFAMWIKFNVAPISGSGSYFSAGGWPTTVLAHLESGTNPLWFFSCNNSDSFNPRSSDQMGFGYFDNVGATAGVNYTVAGGWTPSVGVWYNVVIVAQNTSSTQGTLYLYVNGVLRGSGTITGSMAAVRPFMPIGSSSLAINQGYIGSAYDFGGDITYSTFKAYQGALTSSEVLTTFSSESPLFGYPISPTMSNVMGIKLKNDTKLINPEQAEQLTLLRRLTKLLESQSANDSANRQRVTVDSIAASQTLATISTVTTATAVTAITNALPAGTNNIGSLNLSSQDQKQFIDISRTVYNTNIRSKLTFS